MDNKNYYLQLIIRHLEGDLSITDELELEIWVNQDDSNKQLFEKIKLNWQAGQPEPNIFDAQIAYENLSRKLALPIQETPSLSYSKEKKLPSLRRWLNAAAVFAGVLVVSKFLYVGFFNDTVTYATGADQTATITLPDHSIVTLYGNSSITYSNEWGEEKSRSVFFEGEAFFDVAADKSKPFFVNTSDISIKVLGTSFNVKSYVQDEFIETTLVEGKVEIKEIKTTGETGDQKIILAPNQTAIFSRKTKDLRLAQVNVDPYISLKNENFNFHNKPVSEIIKIISKKFAVSITAENSINDCTVTADFSNQSLPVTLDLLCKLIDAKFSISDKEVILEGEGCKIT